jgi:hypothetical protein
MDARTEAFILGFKDDQPVTWQDALIEGSRDPAAPTHDRFEWDDTAAALRDRRRVASELIARVKIVARYVTEDAPTPSRVKGVFVEQEENGHRHYRTALELDAERETAAETVVREGRHCLGYLRAWINSSAGNFGFDPAVPNQHWQGLSDWINEIDNGDIMPTLPTADEMAARPAKPARRKRTGKAKRSDDRPGASA